MLRGFVGFWLLPETLKHDKRKMHRGISTQSPCLRRAVFGMA